MMQCWRKYASERPHFEEIGDTLDSILEDMHRESYCESDTDDEADTLSREGSKKFPSRTPSFKSGMQTADLYMYTCIYAILLIKRSTLYMYM